MLGEHCDAQVHGLYLMDKEQKMDNYVYVEHAFPNCTSSELFKGILDDVKINGKKIENLVEFE